MKKIIREVKLKGIFLSFLFMISTIKGFAADDCLIFDERQQLEASDYSLYDDIAPIIYSALEKKGFRVFKKAPTKEYPSDPDDAITIIPTSDFLKSFNNMGQIYGVFKVHRNMSANRNSTKDYIIDQIKLIKRVMVRPTTVEGLYKTYPAPSMENKILKRANKPKSTKTLFNFGPNLRQQISKAELTEIIGKIDNCQTLLKNK